ncbi:MAG: collagen-like protein [Bacilli bacterium]|nr:collagen-like protein [Bacilli bacterium]
MKPFVKTMTAIAVLAMLAGCDVSSYTGGGSKQDSNPGESTQGPKGDPGKDGTSFYSGNGVPTGTTYQSGDHYLDLNNGDVYVFRDGAWVKTGNIKGPKGDPGENGTDGQDGQDGKDGKDGKDGQNGEDGEDGIDGQDGQDGAPGQSFLNGKGAPSPELGKSGDTYLDLDTLDLYVKYDEEWTYETSLRYRSLTSLKVLLEGETIEDGAQLSRKAGSALKLSWEVNAGARDDVIVEVEGAAYDEETHLLTLPDEIGEEISVQVTTVAKESATMKPISMAFAVLTAATTIDDLFNLAEETQIDDLYGVVKAKDSKGFVLADHSGNSALGGSTVYVAMENNEAVVGQYTRVEGVYTFAGHEEGHPGHVEASAIEAIRFMDLELEPLPLVTRPNPIFNTSFLNEVTYAFMAITVEDDGGTMEYRGYEADPGVADYEFVWEGLPQEPGDYIVTGYVYAFDESSKVVSMIAESADSLLGIQGEDSLAIGAVDSYTAVLPSRLQALIEEAPEEALPYLFVWSLRDEDEGKATIDENGNVTALAEGEIEITFTFATIYSVKKVVEIVAVPVTEFSATMEKAHLYVGEQDAVLSSGITVSVNQGASKEYAYAFYSDEQGQHPLSIDDAPVTLVDNQGVISIEAKGSAQDPVYGKCYLQFTSKGNTKLKSDMLDVSVYAYKHIDEVVATFSGAEFQGEADPSVAKHYFIKPVTKDGVTVNIEGLNSYFYENSSMSLWSGDTLTIDAKRDITAVEFVYNDKYGTLSSDVGEMTDSMNWVGKGQHLEFQHNGKNDIRFSESSIIVTLGEVNDFYIPAAVLLQADSRFSILDKNNQSYELPEIAKEGDVIEFKLTTEEEHLNPVVTVNNQPLEAVEGVYSITIEGDTSIAISGQEEVAHAVTVSAEHATVTPSIAGDHYAGEQLQFHVDADEGYSLVSVKVGETPLTPDGQGLYTYVMGEEAVTITVTTEAKQGIQVGPKEGSHYTLANVSGSYVGDDVSFDVVPESGYVVDSITINGVQQQVSPSNHYVVNNAQGDVNVVVTMKEESAATSVTFQMAGDKFTVVNSGPQVVDGYATIDKGSNFWIAVKADAGYRIVDITMGQASIFDQFVLDQTTDSYGCTFEKVQEAAVITVVTEALPVLDILADTHEVTVNDTIQLSLGVTNEKQGAVVTWGIKDDDYKDNATIDQNGVLTGKVAGIVNVEVSYTYDNLTVTKEETFTVIPAESGGKTIPQGGITFTVGNLVGKAYADNKNKAIALGDIAATLDPGSYGIIMNQNNQYYTAANGGTQCLQFKGSSGNVSIAITDEIASANRVRIIYLSDNHSSLDKYLTVKYGDQTAQASLGNIVDTDYNANKDKTKKVCTREVVYDLSKLKDQTISFVNTNSMVIVGSIIIE